MTGPIDWTAGERANLDQAHATIRDLGSHIGHHADDSLSDGVDPQDAAWALAVSLYGSTYTRGTLAMLLGVALVDLSLARHKRNGGPM